MADNMEDLLAGLDIEGLDDVDDISGDKLQKLVDNIEITASDDEQYDTSVEQNMSRGSAADFKKKDSSLLMEDDLDEIDDDEIDDVEIEDVDALLKQAFLDEEDDDIDEDNVENAINAALFNEEEKKDSSDEKDNANIDNNIDDSIKENIKDDYNSLIDESTYDQEVINNIVEDIDTEDVEESTNDNKKSTKARDLSEEVTLETQDITEKVDENKKKKKEKGRKKLKKEKKEKNVDAEENTDKPKLKTKMFDMAEKLFYNIPDAKYDEQLYREEEIAANKKINQKEKKAKRAEAKKQAEAEAKAKRLEEKEKEKAKKEELKKKKTAQKKAEKDRRKAEAAEEAAREPIGRINKLGAMVVATFVGVICLGIILFANSLRQSIDFEKEAEILMNQGKYEMAYIKLLMDPELDKESILYQQLHVIQTLNKQISYYSSAVSLHDREKALHALIVGIEKYDSDKKTAKILSIGKEYNDVYREIVSLLKSEFDISVSEARDLSYINSDREYAERIVTICEESKK